MPQRGTGEEFNLAELRFISVLLFCTWNSSGASQFLWMQNLHWQVFLVNINANAKQPNTYEAERRRFLGWGRGSNGLFSFRAFLQVWWSLRFSFQNIPWTTFQISISQLHLYRKKKKKNVILYFPLHSGIKYMKIWLKLFFFFFWKDGHVYVGISML